MNIFQKIDRLLGRPGMTKRDLAIEKTWDQKEKEKRAERTAKKDMRSRLKREKEWEKENKIRRKQDLGFYHDRKLDAHLKGRKFDWEKEKLPNTDLIEEKRHLKEQKKKETALDRKFRRDEKQIAKIERAKDRAIATKERKDIRRFEKLAEKELKRFNRLY